ncbi:pyruvate carboxylase [Alkalilimnicola sp. S0819]|uniref:pyruvate carboxylase n=1 Tax=Alkalilimnicola sp. S0819 TaxID=2613922 RepID=UPI001261D417|nr:pyruvate carboxylase [Alkalilimnicola sp. S0819]KAB7624378.1 pyruvate carboxylase [Alkalilimnicola sp. S0819]MPQ16204.1 pyruvate carboxylase [Alkalilimnicola sp. S0819]
MTQTRQIQRLLVANRSEIAIRVMRAAAELGIRTIAIYSEEDRFALHRFKADEAYEVGRGSKPIAAYLDIDEVMRIAREAGADAIHPGYGFLSENPDLAEACAREGILFVGPHPDVMRSLGNKVSARNLAEQAGVPVVPATGALPSDLETCKTEAAKVGYPLMLKASWGGGGRGMRVVEDESQLEEQLRTARAEAASAFGNDEVYLEKLVRRARHVEVQVLGDTHGNLVHLFERDCTVQRRNQKVVERAPAPYLDDDTRESLCQSALRLARAAGYYNAGTVEFLMDADSGEFYFIEVNPRIQVEHTVTEEVTGIDIVKAQIRIAEGNAIGDGITGVPEQARIKLEGHALQCRVTTEDPENGFTPDYGRISAYRGATGFGIRLDGGTAYSGALITPFYDSLLEKVTAWAPTPEDAIRRMDRALREFRIRGVSTNLPFLENVINHPSFVSGSYTTRFIDDTPELFDFADRQDRATRLLRFLSDVIVNGNPEVAGRPAPKEAPPRAVLPGRPSEQIPRGTRDRLLELGPEGFAAWMKEAPQVLVTDTTMRDAHQSLFATRMRSRDMWEIAPHYARLLPELFSLECWGGATFDVAMRFLKECPWERLDALRERIPNIPFQMLLRASNGVGYTNYPDNVVRYFVQQAAAHGMDIFRVFDSLNWVENMRVAMDAVIESGAVCEGTICYSGDLLDPAEDTYTLKYYLNMAKALEAAGAHILGIKDMAGVAKPDAIAKLVTELKQEISLPIHFHTHDTSGISAASVLAAVGAGVDAVDGAMDAFSGQTSQPNLGAIAEALRWGPRDTGLQRENLRAVNHYWEGVRRYYSAFESDIRSGTSDVYHHAMPGGQYTNLREQARGMGLERHWPEVADTYAQVNELFGNIVKVTPSSKVVGDMALMMVTSDLTAEQVLDPEHEVNFPDSVKGFFRGELGQPVSGFPEALQKKVLGDEAPLTARPGAVLPAADLDALRAEAEAQVEREITDAELASYLMYPKVFVEYARHREAFGNVSVLPTHAFFHGLESQEEVSIDIERGKRLILRCLAISEADEEGKRRVFFELNGQPRRIKVADTSLAPKSAARRKVEPGKPGQIAAPMAGLIVHVAVNPGQKVRKGDHLFSIEAMKMETAIHAERDGTVEEVLLGAGTQVDSKDLVLVVV